MSFEFEHKKSVLLNVTKFCAFAENLVYMGLKPNMGSKPNMGFRFMQERKKTINTIKMYNYINCLVVFLSYIAFDTYPIRKIIS